MIKLYTHPMSSNARRAVMTAHLLGIPFESVVIDLAKGEQKKPEYLAQNPNGRVPLMVDGDVVLWESLAIMTYLAEKTAGQTLYPTELVARAQVNKWLFWSAAHWGPAAAQLNYENMLKKMFGQGEPDAYTVKRAEALFQDFAGTLDAELGRRRFIAGETLTLADVAIAPTLMYSDMAKLPIAGRDHLARWFGEMRELDAWKKTDLAR